jgi:serine/threonine protein kinase/tetratricopeptide (TPR) repeat protein
MIGQTISHYKILEKLGEGGMGVVYKAHDTKLDRLVALKFLPQQVTVSDEDKARFLQEAKAISVLNHPNIATIHDIDELDGHKFLVLEYIPGGTLKSKLKYLKSEDKEFSLAEVLDYGIQAAEALAHAHRHQIVHRDVKTDNLMLTEEGKVKLTDFGLAKLRGSVQVTKTGTTVGTAAYMSPEQIRGEEIDQRSDIFSFGVVLYELLTSHLPFRGEFETALSYSILNENPQPVKSLRKDAPASLEKVIDRCLEKDKTKRYQSADDIVAELRKVQQEITGTVRIVAKQSKVPWIIAALMVALAAISIYVFYPKLAPTAANSKAIAVLPFKNLSDSKEDEYFADGITEDLITQLSKIADLKVISRTSVMQYKGISKNVRDIGKDLDVGAVLEGSVRRAGNQVRIVAQLIDANNEGHLWAETYDKEMTQVFAIQSDVAQRIATALKTKLSLVEKGRIERKQTENTEAYQLYLKGRFYWNKRRIDDLKTAIGYFNQAIEKDPSYAMAYAGLAATYVLLPQYGLPQAKYPPLAEAAAEKALSLDATLGEAHAVLGVIASDYKWDWEGAEKEYLRAIELNPSYPTAHQWYSTYLTYVRRFDESLSEVQRAHDLDPLSLVINMCLGDALYAMRQYDRTLEQYEKTVALDPNFPWGHYALGQLYEVLGKFDEAIAEYQKARTLGGKGTVGLSGLGHAYAKSGRRNAALKVLDELSKISEPGYSASYDRAFVYSGLDDREKTFQWLEKAYEERATGLLALAYDPLWDSLRSDPRFIALLKKMGLPR